MQRIRHLPPKALVAGAGFLISIGLVILAGWPLTHAVALPTVEEVPVPGVTSPPSRETRFADEDTPDLVNIASDPFRPDRAPPKIALLIGGGAVGDSTTPEPTQPIVLIGTAVLPNGGGFATCQIGNEPARLVRIGESLAGYTLRAVAQGRATFRTADGEELEVRVAKAGS